MNSINRSLLTIIPLALSAFLSGGARAENDALKNQTIRVIISEDAGQTTDTHARLFFSHFSKLNPSAKVLVQNKPGGGGGKAIKELIESSPDTITVAVFSRSPVYEAMAAPEDAKFDLKTLKWLGSLAKVNRLVAVRTGLNAPDLSSFLKLDKLVTFGGSKKIGASGLEPVVISALTDVKMRTVTGIDEGQRDAMLLSGDIDGRTGNIFELADKFKAGQLVAILKFTKDGYPDEYSKLPTLMDLASESKYKGAAVALGMIDQVGGEMLAASPNTAPDVVAALRDEISAVAADKDFLAEAGKISFFVSPVSGSDLEKTITELLSTDTAINQSFRAAFECGLKKSEAGTEGC